MAIHPLCGIRSPSAAGFETWNHFSGQREAFIREEESRIHGKWKREREKVENEVESRRFQRHRSGIRQFGSHSSHPANSYGANTRNSLWIITKIPDILAYKPCWLPRTWFVASRARNFGQYYIIAFWTVVCHLPFPCRRNFKGGIDFWDRVNLFIVKGTIRVNRGN